MGDQLSSLVTLFTEFYYWVTVVFMFFIHAGFCVYEVGVSREKNKLHTLLKNTMIIPIVTIPFFAFGWWIYFAWQGGPGITNGIASAPWATAWSELMGTHMGGQPYDISLTPEMTATWARVNGVFWAAFLLFSWTTASIISGAAIERIRSQAYWLIAALVGAFTWMVGAAWGWSADGWMVNLLGFHDAYASGIVHGVAGGSTLAVLIHLGPRIGRFRKDGTARTIPPHNVWLTTIGLFLVFCGFWGFYAACNIPMWDIDPNDGKTFFSATTIYLTPTTLSAVTVNFIMSFCGGLMAGYFISKGDAYWTYSGGLAGIICASAGNDLYHPAQAFILAIIGVPLIYKLHYWMEKKFKIDDAVGAVAVHGFSGVFGVVAAGFLLWGYPASPNSLYGTINPLGNTLGAVICFVALGFVPCYVLGYILKKLNLLRVPQEVELAGLDFVQIDAEEKDYAEIFSAEKEFKNNNDKKAA